MSTTEERRARRLIEDVGPRPALAQWISENDARIRSSDLNDGRSLAAARTAIHTELVRAWAIEQHRAASYDKPFAVVALGGTGRAEMAPASDHDFAFLFVDALEANPFFLELQRQVLHTNEFERRYGFACQAQPFSLDDMPKLSGKQLNAFLDIRGVYDPHDLAGRFRERIRSTYDPFEHFLHVRGFWKDRWERAAAASERLDRFDIKNDGLRLFLAGIWILAGQRFVHSHEIYAGLEDPRDLKAYDFLLRIRAFVHSRRSHLPGRAAGGNHPEDVLGFDDFTAFGELLGPDTAERDRFEFANEVRARLLAARRRVACFGRGVIERELRHGRVVHPGSSFVCGAGGLRHVASSPCPTAVDKSRAALGLLLAAQHYGVTIDPAELQTTFCNAGDWLVRVPELSALFYERRGSLADSFEFLAQIEGTEERLFPGYAKFEASIDNRVLTERKTLRGALERQKTRVLEAYVTEGRQRLGGGGSVPRDDLAQGVVVAAEAALLDADHLAGIKLALKTKRLPRTLEDEGLREDADRPLHDRYASGLSGIPLTRYYRPYLDQCEFTPETIRVAEFLVAHRRAFKERAEAGLNDARQVEEFVQLCQDEHLLRSLFVFTCADRAEWESEVSDPARWFNNRELYAKAMSRFRPGLDPDHFLRAAGYTPDQLTILKDFGETFFGGVYRPYANRFGAHLLRLAEDPDAADPKVSLLRDGRSTIVGVAARDYRGLAASISGALWHKNIPLRQAHLFSAANHGLALDFFHLAPRDRPLEADTARFVERVIRERSYIARADESNLPRVTGRASLLPWRPGQYCLRFETGEAVSGLIYALTYKVFRHLQGNIFGLAATHSAREQSYVSIYLSLPPWLPAEEASHIVGRMF